MAAIINNRTSLNILKILQDVEKQTEQDRLQERGERETTVLSTDSTHTHFSIQILGSLKPEQRRKARILSCISGP